MLYEFPINFYDTSIKAHYDEMKIYQLILREGEGRDEIFNVNACLRELSSVGVETSKNDNNNNAFHDPFDTNIIIYVLSSTAHPNTNNSNMKCFLLPLLRDNMTHNSGSMTMTKIFFFFLCINAKGNFSYKQARKFVVIARSVGPMENFNTPPKTGKLLFTP